MKTKKEAAIEINDIYNSLECRKNTLSTTLKKMFYDKDRDAYRVIGYAHDYSVFCY